MTTTHTAMDVQGFAGGFACGMVQAGFELVGKAEMKGAFGAPNMEANRHILGDRWDLQEGPQETWENRGAEVVFGNPPCSAFSALSHKDFRGMDSPVSHCMWAMAQYAARAMPYIVTFESVQQAYNQGLPMMRDIHTWLEWATSTQWTLYHVLHNNASVGGCSIRKRYFWLATRIPFGIEMPEIERVPTLEDALGDLLGLGQTWERQPYRRDPSWWARQLRTADGLVDGHIGRNQAPDTMRALQLLEGTNWAEGEIISEVARRYFEKYGELPTLWNGSSEKLVAKDWRMGYHQPSRWHWERMARVITGAGLHKVLHPREDRFLTHREVARIQGFPDDWRILPLRGKPGLSNTWGKGIPVQAGLWHGTWIKAALDGEPGSHTGKQIGDHEFVIDVTNVYRKVSTER